MMSAQTSDFERGDRGPVSKPHTLKLPTDFPFPAMVSTVAADDSMFTGDSDHYLAVGASALACIEQALHGRIPHSILDLPCGWGRVTRILRARYPDAELTVSDIDAAAVAFTARTFDATGLVSTEDLRDLRLPGGYDLIWVGSLITHLSEAQSRLLLQGLKAALRPDGIVVISSHGPSIIPSLTTWGYGLPPPVVAGLLDDYGARGFGHRGYGGGAGYGISLTDQGWWLRLAAELGLNVEHYAAQAWNEHQDVVVLSRYARAVHGTVQAEADLPSAERMRAAEYDPVMRVFDEDLYFRTYPDVAAAVRGGEVASAFVHYLHDGRREGRRPHAEREQEHDAPLERFDEDWYLSTYPDVAEAVAGGSFRCGQQHYREWGRAEGRLSHADAKPVLTEQERRDRVGAVWSVNPQAAPGWYWMAHPMVRARVNALASGDPMMDSYGRLKLLLQSRGVPLPLGRAISLGCGFGALERGLVADGIIREIDAYDIAPGAIAEARRLAAEAGLDGLRYHVADLETMELPPTQVDVVFAHSSVHHVGRLEELFAAVAAMLKPGGIFHLNEFVGPTRFQWTDAQIALVNQFLQSLPPRLRRLPSGQPRPLQSRPTVADMIATDPSEAIRSSDIIPVIGRYFDILEQRDLGGALLHLGLGEIAQNFDPDSPEDRAVLEAFFAAEDKAMQDGVVGSDFAIITAVARAPTSHAKPEAATSQPSLLTRLSVLFPPVRRLRQTVRTLNESVSRLR